MPKAKDDLHLQKSKTVLFATRRVRLVSSRHRPISITMTTNDNNNERNNDKKIKEHKCNNNKVNEQTWPKFEIESLQLNNERSEFQV